MRNGIAWKIVMVVLIGLALMSATAFAYVGKPAVESKVQSAEFLE